MMVRAWRPSSEARGTTPHEGGRKKGTSHPIPFSTFWLVTSHHVSHPVTCEKSGSVPLPTITRYGVWWGGVPTFALECGCVCRYLQSILFIFIFNCLSSSSSSFFFFFFFFCVSVFLCFCVFVFLCFCVFVFFFCSFVLCFVSSRNSVFVRVRTFARAWCRSVSSVFEIEI